MISLNSNLTYLKGIGEKRAKLLASELNLYTYEDLLYNFPNRHMDKSRFYKIAELKGEMQFVQLKGKFLNFFIEGEGAKRRLKGVFTDGSKLIEIIWFSKIETIRKILLPNKEYVLFGKPKEFRGVYSITHPEIEVYDPDKKRPGVEGIYSLTEKLRKHGYTPRFFSKEVGLLFETTGGDIIYENLPEFIIGKYQLMSRREALFEMHFPSSESKLQQARRRMKFEELYFMQLNILRFAQSRNKRIIGHKFEKVGDCFNTFYRNHIPFELTGAQKRVLKEIRFDMRTGQQMNRLLQGDVGCGKTMVAFMSMLIAIDNDYQAAIIAPTEILAQQHYETIARWAVPLSIKVALLTGSVRSSKRREILEGIESGDIKITIGTHALLEHTVCFKQLGLAVIDEQHRFGVQQRAKMWQKNTIPPHVLVMTATPIPRTLAMTLYGDLEVSVIDELPPGRTPIQTTLFYDSDRMRMVSGVKAELLKGHQVYFVYPLIKENEKLSYKSIEEGFADVCRAFEEYNVCCVHGQMKAEHKEKEMQRFVAGEAQIMVATTVIEVGVNVPNACVMVIENAERFGLSQLHQLRGRVGRGAARSYCVLMSKQKIAKETRERLEVMTSTTDGFVVAEADMKLRGPGDLEGTQQSGMALTLKIADIATDGRILSAAREEARKIIEANPEFLGFNENIEDANHYRLDKTNIGIHGYELNKRFGRDTDWSQIS